MKNSNRIFRVEFRQLSSALAAAFLVLLPGVNSLHAAAPPATTTIRHTGTDFEGRSTYRLEWDAESDLVYRIQARASLETNAPWTIYDLVRATSARASFDAVTEQGVSPETGARGFFQVLQPQTEIFRVEPALLGTNGGTLYVFGQCFGTNLSLRLGTLVLPPNPLQPGAPYSFTIASGALGAGIYDVEILDGTNVLATAEKLFSVTSELSPVGASAGGYARLLEVPQDPPGSPVIDASLLMPALMKVKEKVNRTKCRNNLSTMPNGELQMCEVDCVIPGRGLDFVWARTYRSRTGTNTVMGQGWSHSYDIRCFTGPSSVTIQDGTGRHDTYQGETNGLFMADELFNVGVFTNDQFVLTFPDGGRWEFVPTNAVNAGRVARIVDRNDNALTFAYSPGGQLLAIVDTLGRTNVLTYDGTGRLARLTDFLGRTHSYRYWRQGESGGGNGDLRSVTTPPVVGTPNTNDFPAGKTTSYTYSKNFPDDRLNHNLLTMTDALGQEWLHVTYKDEFVSGRVDFDRVASVQRGVNPPSMFTYVPQTPAPDNRWAVLKTLENDPVGNVTMDWFDSLNRSVIHRDLAARAVPGELLIDGQLPTENLRENDPEFWDTTYEWNVDSLCTRVTCPRGNSTEIVHQRAKDHNSSRSNKTNTRHNDGNPIVVREVACCDDDSDGDGLDDTLITRFTYDPRFGSPAGLTFPLTREVSLPGDQSGLVVVTSLLPDTSRQFATRVVDPRGFVMTCDYDGQGNRVALTHEGRLLDGSDSPVTNFEYDPTGQLVAVVHPLDANGERRRDEFTYLNARLRSWAVDTTKPDTTITRYGRDAVGNMTELVDPNGNTNQFIYNALDQLMKKSSLVHCAGCSALTEEFTYDANDNLVRTEFSNHDFTGGLDTNNPSWTTLYQYDLRNLRTLIAHELAHVVQQRFASNRFVYDANDNLLEEHSPEAVKGSQPSNWVKHSYDTRDLRFTTTSAPGTADSSTDEFDYDPNGNLARSSRGGGGGAGGSIRLQSFDGFDRLATATDPLGNVQTFTYDANDNLLSERLDGQTNDVAGGAGNRRLSFTRYEYDGLDRTTARRVSFFDVFTEVSLTDGESTTTWAYAPDGGLRRVTDDNGHATRYSYDSQGRLQTVTDAKTNLTTYLYDPNGNVTQAKQVDRSDAAGALSEFTRTFQYDELDRCVLEFDNVGNTDQYAYDSRGNLARHLDARSVLHGWTYDGLNNVVLASGDLDGDSVFEPLADFTLSQEFDDNSRLVASRDANSNLTLHAYDALDRHITTTNTDRTTRKLVWSPRSNLVRTEDANGTVVSNSFDLLDRCVRRDITPGGGVLPTTMFEIFAYDGASQLVLASNDVSMLEFSRDSLGNTARSKQDCIAAFATFDGVGNRLSLTYPTGGVVNFTYNALDEVSSVSRTFGGQTRALASFAYEGPGRVGRMTRTNGINTRLAWNGMKNPPNAQGDSGWGQVSSVNHQFALGGATIDRRISAYDRNQNKILRQQTVPFATGVPALTTNVFGYDALNRMTSFDRRRASTISTKSLALDKQGNRQTVSSNGVVEIYAMDAGTPEPSDFQMNQYTITPFGTELHDPNGNLVSIDSPAGATQFSYDFADRLVLVQRTVGPALVPVASFTYDALGRRISKTTFPDAPALPVTTYFVLDLEGDDILEERDNGVPQVFAVWPHMHQLGGHARISPAGEILWVHVDEMGTAVALTDDGGNVLERYDYAEFGEPRFYTAEGVPMVDAQGRWVAQSPQGVHHLFGGMFWDGETGLYACKGIRRITAEMYLEGRLRFETDPYAEDASRYMDPKTGRSLTRFWGDPHVMEKDGTRWDFAQGGNNPWSPAQTGKKGLNAVNVKLARTSSASVVKKVGVRGWDPEKKISLVGDAEDAISVYYNPKELTVDRTSPRDPASGLATGKRVSSPRDAASGMATGRRSYAPGHFSLDLDGKRDSASGLPTGRRLHAPRDVASGQATGKRISSPRDPVSGLATGKRMSSPRDPASGLATGKRQHLRDAASGLATGRRTHSPRDAASGLATGRRTHAPRDASSGLATGRRQ